jgi:4-carboxymuconolactone decarboxylase
MSPLSVSTCHDRETGARVLGEYANISCNIALFSGKIVAIACYYAKHTGETVLFKPRCPAFMPNRSSMPIGNNGKEGVLMARIDGIPPRQAGWYAKLAYYFTRRSLRRLAGRETDRMIEPLQMYAHAPKLLKGYAGLEQATAKLKRLDKRLHALAELKAATIVQCEYCIDLGSQIARQWGISDAELLALPHYRTSPLFSELDKLVLDYAVAMSRTPAAATDALVAELRRRLDDRQIVELTHFIALENMRGRFNSALGIGQTGFSAGMVCAVPAGADQEDEQRTGRM